MSSVRKRTMPSGKAVWQVDYKDQAGVRRSKQFRTKKEATDYETKARAEVVSGTHVAESATASVDRAKVLLIESLKGEGAAPSTLHNYNIYYANHVAPFLADRLLTRIGPADVQDYLDRLRMEGRTADTIRRAKNVLGAIFDEALRRRLVGTNPVRVLRPRRRMRRIAIVERAERAIVIPEREEVRQLIDAAAAKQRAWIIVRERAGTDWVLMEAMEFAPNDRPRKRLAAAKATYPAMDVLLFRPAPWLRPLLVTLAFSGLRIGEARGLSWDNVGDDVLSVERGADASNEVGPVKTPAAMRKVPLGPYLANTLAVWKNSSDGKAGGLVFASEAGGVLTYSNIVNRGVALLQVALGMVDKTGRPRYTPHSFRHFCVSLWIDSGADPKQVAQWVGHESAAFTLDCYAHLFEKRRRDRTHITAAEESVFGIAATQAQHEPVVEEENKVISIR